MLKEIKEKCESISLTIISGIFLLLSLGLLITKKYVEINISPYLDTAFITILISGYPLIFEAIRKLFKEKKISSALLISIAMIASILVKEIFAAGEVAFIMAIGEILEDKTVDKAKKGLNNLISLKPKTGRLISDGNENIINIDDIKIGDILRILPGESIPVDGIVLNGESTINESILTGESIPVDKRIDDNVYQGTININGSIDIKALNTSNSSSLDQMIELIKEAEKNEAPIKRIADKWASILVPVAFLIAIIVFILTYIFIGNENNEALIRGVTILVVFCPCALSLATPTSVVAAIGQATKYGVLIKSGEALEEISKTNTIIFDKTGTLTLGEMEVTDVYSFNELNNSEILKLSASIEKRSEHPLAKAILNKAIELNLKLKDVSSFVSDTGIGVKGIIDNSTYRVGNTKYISNLENILTEENYETINNLRREGKVTTILYKEETPIGIIAIQDKIRENAYTTIEELKNDGYNISLLTGDNNLTATYFANKLKIDDVNSELLPTDKVNIIKEYRNSGLNVSMVGDGVNDAPALKQANTGISLMSIGSDITVNASDISLLNDDISKIPYLMRLSKATVKTIKFNIAMSMIINFIAIVLSTLGILNPITGAIVHNVGSLLIVLNASLIYNRNFISKK